jgi:hypothetical protein
VLLSSAVPDGTVPLADVFPRTSVLGYFQPSLRDWVVAGVGGSRTTMKLVLGAEKQLLGFAHRFRPTYALANVGHPPIPNGVAMTRKSSS